MTPFCKALDEPEGGPFSFDVEALGKLDLVGLEAVILSQEVLPNLIGGHDRLSRGPKRNFARGEDNVLGHGEVILAHVHLP